MGGGGAVRVRRWERERESERRFFGPEGGVQYTLNGETIINWMQWTVYQMRHCSARVGHERDDEIKRARAKVWGWCLLLPVWCDVMWCNLCVLWCDLKCGKRSTRLSIIKYKLKLKMLYKLTLKHIYEWEE